MIKFEVTIRPEESIPAGVAAIGRYEVSLETEHLTALSAEEREFLASLDLKIPDGLVAKPQALTPADPDCPRIVDPSPEALLAWVREAHRLNSARLRAHNARARADEERHAQAREACTRALIDHLVAHPEELVTNTVVGGHYMLRTQGFGIDSPDRYEWTDGEGRWHYGMVGVADVLPELREKGVVAEAERLVEQKNAELARRKEERQRADEEARAKKAAEAEAYEAERARWIGEHGSARLKKALALGVADTCQSLYVSERLAIELPGWQFDPDPDSKWKDIKNPSLALLEAFEAEKQNALLTDVAMTFIVWHDYDTGNAHKWTALSAYYKSHDTTVVRLVEDRS